METTVLTISEAARRLAVTPSAIRKWILQRRIAYTKIGRCVRVPASEIERLVSNGLRPVRNTSGGNSTQTEMRGAR